MEKRQRMTLLGIAAAIAAAAIVIALVAGGDDGEQSDTTTGAPATETQTGAGGDTTATTEPAEPKPPPEPEVTEIRVRDGEPVGGVKEIEAKKGDTVRIDVTSDTADELHLHVYDVTKRVRAGETTRLTFTANVEGVVELELHGSGTQIAEITVEPS